MSTTSTNTSTPLPGRFTLGALRDRLPARLGLDLEALNWPTVAALWVLSLFEHDDAAVWNHVSADGIDVDRLLAGNTSGRPLGEQLLVRAAASIATSRWEVSLHDLALELDPISWAAVSDALRVLHQTVAGGSR